MPTSEGLKESVEKLCVNCDDNDFGWSGTWLLPKRLFRGCNLEGLQAVAKRLQPVSFKDSDVVFRAGDDGKSMYFVNSGSVRVEIEKKVVDTLEPGCFFGEVGMMLCEKRTADVLAAGDCELLELHVDSFFEVASEFPAIANSLRVQLGNVGSARIKKASTTMRMVISGDYHPCALKQREIPSITGSPEGSERVKKWNEDMLRHERDRMQAAIVKVLPVGSNLKSMIQSFEVAEKLMQDPVRYVQGRLKLEDHFVRALSLQPWLENAPPMVVAEALSRLTWKTFRAGEQVMKAEGSISKLYIVSSGSVRVLVGGSKGCQTRCLTPPHAFGVAGFCAPDRGLRAMEAYAVEESKVAEMGSEAIVMLCDLFPELWSNIGRLRLIYRAIPRVVKSSRGS
mmetsp:Transcript_31571/g.100976  ORF Transcript_31571/g.100976 Transcript_31571/m.100976 type:complete len:396 (-) Transcript_31571:49-1236(-)